MALFKPNIKKLQEEKNVKKLIKLLDFKRDWSIQINAARALGKIGNPLAVEPLIVALTNDNYRVREAAAESLGQIGDSRAIYPLIATYKTEPIFFRATMFSSSKGREMEKMERVWNAVADALGKLGQPAIIPLIDSLKKMDMIGAIAYKHVGNALGKIGTPAVEPLIAALKHYSKWAPHGAARALGKIGDPRAVGPLIDALKDEDSSLRQTAVFALGEIGDTRAVEPLIAALKDEDSNVRQAAAWVLGEAGEVRALEPLIAVLKDEDSNVRQAAAWALGEAGEARALEPLIAALKDEDSNVRQAAAKALGKIGEARAMEPLIAALKDNDRFVRRNAAEALKSIKRNAEDDLPFTKIHKEQPGKSKLKETKCQYCGKQLRISSGGFQAVSLISGNNIEDVFSQAQNMAQNMLNQKIVCSSCGAVFCLECGNAEGHKRGTGKTHCPECGKVASLS